MKKYCECFQAGVHCTDLCKCDNCKNCEAHNHAFKSKGELESEMAEDENSQFTAVYHEELSERSKKGIPQELEFSKESKPLAPQTTGTKSKKKSKGKF